MTDTTNLDAGDDAENVIAGKKNRQTSQRADPRQSMHSGDINFANSDNLTIWYKLLEMKGDIQGLAEKLDDLPNRVGKLERVEITVRDKDVVIKTAAPPDAIVLPMRTLLFTLSALLIVVVIAVGYLLWQVR